MNVSIILLQIINNPKLYQNNEHFSFQMLRKENFYKIFISSVQNQNISSQDEARLTICDFATKQVFRNISCETLLVRSNE